MSPRKRISLLVFACGMTFAAERFPAVFKVGVQTHFSQHKGLLEVNMSLIHQAGANAVREGVYWASIETTKGQFAMPAEYDANVDNAVKLGIEPLRVLGGSNPLYDNGGKPVSDEALDGYARYCEFVVRHFKGKVRLYEIWNEWNQPSRRAEGPSTPDSYAKVLKAVYRRMKAVDPSITVLGGAPTAAGVRSGWIQSMLAAGALDNIDAVSIHTYTYHSGGRDRTPEAWVEWIKRLEPELQRYSGGKEVPLYVTEMGWPVHIGRDGTPRDVAATYLARTFLLARTMPFLKAVWWYDFQNDGWDPTHNEHNFGLVRADLSPLPGYFALASVADLASQAAYLGRVETTDPDIWALKFRHPNGKDTLVIWSTHEDDDWQVTLQTAQPSPPPVMLGEVGRLPIPRAWGGRDWATANGREVRRDAPVVPNLLTVTVRDMPWLVTGDLDGVTVAAVLRREFTESRRAAQPQQ